MEQTQAVQSESPRARGMQLYIEGIVRSPYFEIVSGFALAFFYAIFLFRHVQALAGGFNPISIIVVCMEGLLVLFFLTRRRAKARTADMVQYLFAMLGTFLPLGLRPTGLALASEFGASLIILGSCIALAGYLSLNRSFGMSPALRQVKTRGLYRFVRHPIYASYFISYFGYLLMAAQPLNILLIVVWVYAQIRRAVYEEQILVQSEEYREYTQRVPWRFIPGII